MIDVGMRKNDRIEVLYRKWKFPVLVGRFLAPSLKHSAVERDSISVYVQKVTRARDLSCSTNECDLQAASLPLLHRAEKGS
jgi:hypothetical protein